jgi:nitrite reductase/ring-hydroxylating ferredoxin subunit
MSEGWRSWTGAPRKGAPVCRADEIPDDGTRCLTLRSDAGEFPLLLVRRKGGLRAFVNACPHQYMPLDWRSSTLLSSDGTRLMCSVHGAIFDASTGSGIAGTGAEDGLEAVPVHVDADGVVRIAED